MLIYEKQIWNMQMSFVRSSCLVLLPGFNQAVSGDTRMCDLRPRPPVWCLTGTEGQGPAPALTANPASLSWMSFCCRCSGFYFPNDIIFFQKIFFELMKSEINNLLIILVHQKLSCLMRSFSLQTSTAKQTNIFLFPQVIGKNMCFLHTYLISLHYFNFV